MSNHDDTALREVLSAAEAVLAARENQMLTSEEWDALAHAVAAATQPIDGPNETFSVRESVLTRSVVPKRGTPYQHTCDQDVFEAVTHLIDELNGATFTYEEVRQTLAAIRSGPPYPYERDGISFGNRERLLPSKPRGYYREYTVRTPGERTRGARRIVCGGEPKAPEACWYSDDHYQSFRKILE